MKYDDKVYALFCERNRKAYTKICLDALENQSYKNLKIVMVDDGSSDGTLRMVKDNYSEVEIIVGNGNLWWSGGMRKGIAWIMGNAKDSEYVLMLNNDTTFDKNFVERLVKSCKLNKESPVGSIGKSLKTKKVLYHVHKVVGGKTQPRVLNYKLDQNKLIYDTDCLNGKGVIVPLKVFKKVGTFSKLFPHYAADYDFFYRAKRKGFQLAIDPNSVVYTLDDDKNLTEIIMEKDRISFRDFFKLFFNRKSSFNLYSTLLHIIIYVPFPLKIKGVYRTLLLVIKVLSQKVI